MILIIDNYDSFTYNLVQYIGTLNPDLEVHRNDKLTLDEIRKIKPERIVISPGPGKPEDAGLSIDVVKEFGPSIPLLGVCLGHQSIGQVFGGEIVRAEKLMHGKTSMIKHNGKGLFEDVPNPFEATRYHSLLIKKDSLPDCLEITAEAKTENKEIMGIRHKEFPIHGLQFHPESILTGNGKKLLSNFLKI